MGKDVNVGSLVEVPSRLARDADFTVPVWVTRTLFTKYLEFPWATAESQERWLGHILYRCRKEIDCWWGDEKDVFEVGCVLPVGFHDCCQAECSTPVTLKAVFRYGENGDLSLIISLPDEG